MSSTATPPTPQPISSDLPRRVATALIALAFFLLVLFALPPVMVLTTFALITAIAGWEWAGLMGQGAPARAFFAALILLFCWQCQIMGEAAIMMFCATAAIFWLAIAPFWLRQKWCWKDNDFVGYALGIILLVATWLGLSTLYRQGPWVLISVLAIAWISDIAAYFAGKHWGRHKLAPLISPGKSREGALAALLLTALLWPALIFPLFPHANGISFMTWVLLIIAILLLVLAGIEADLFESLLKRQAGCKDSGKLLPGHGGVLDRIDSQMAILPLAALLLQATGH